MHILRGFFMDNLLNGGESAGNDLIKIPWNMKVKENRCF